MPDEGLLALEKFNAGEYYEQHDRFEHLWMVEKGPVRDLYRAILQVGVAYYQITRGNLRGARKMLLRSIQWLALLPDVCRGVDVAQVRRDANAVRAELDRVGEDGAKSFDTRLLKGIRQATSED
jgi:predicted metal-dependent hydrolase